jgi:hypothetical protein
VIRSVARIDTQSTRHDATLTRASIDMTDMQLRGQTTPERRREKRRESSEPLNNLAPRARKSRNDS